MLDAAGATVGSAWRRTARGRAAFVALGQVVVAALGKPPIRASDLEQAFVGVVL